MMVCRSTLPLAPYKSSCAIGMVAVPRRGRCQTQDHPMLWREWVISRKAEHLCMYTFAWRNFPRRFPFPLGQMSVRELMRENISEQGDGSQQSRSP